MDSVDSEAKELITHARWIQDSFFVNVTAHVFIKCSIL